MRLSTTQFYQQGLTAMQNQQSKLQKTEHHLATGLRIMSPADDPSGAVLALNLNDNIAAIGQFERNASVAENQLSLEENVVSSVTDVLQRVRELSIQGNNATNSNESRRAIGIEINERLDEMLALANSRDASGEYLFSGYRVDSPPFTQSAGNFSYNGDNGQRHVQIGEGTQIAIRDSGRAVFQEIPSGNGSFEVSAGTSNTGSGVIGQSGLVGSFVPDTYTVTFGATAVDGSVSYQVTDSALTVVSSGNYSDGESIKFSGAQITLSGQPANGDTFTVQPSKNQDIFSTVKSIADALINPASTQADTTAFHNTMAQGLSNLDQAMTHMSEVRSGIGARLNNIDAQRNINADFQLQLEKVLSETVDLDYADAISEFNLQLTSLQAAQQVYVKTQELSLFRFL